MGHPINLILSNYSNIVGHSYQLSWIFLPNSFSTVYHRYWYFLFLLWGKCLKSNFHWSLLHIILICLLLLFIFWKASVLTLIFFIGGKLLIFLLQVRFPSSEYFNRTYKLRKNGSQWFINLLMMIEIIFLSYYIDIPWWSWLCILTNSIICIYSLLCVLERVTFLLQFWCMA